jgi:drug/metabolite transporter (DMT)-like permease
LSLSRIIIAANGPAPNQCCAPAAHEFATSIKHGRRPPAKPARSVLDGREHGGILTAVGCQLPKLRAVYTRVLTAANTRGAAPIILTLIAFLALDERLDPLQIAAVILTSAGIFLLVIGKGTDQKATAFAIATGISIAAYSFFGALGVRASADVLGFQAWLEVLTGLGVLSFIALRRRNSAIVEFIQASYRTGLLAGILSVAGYLTYLAAAQVLPLGPVSALRESSVIVGALIGAILLREGFAARRIAAAIMVTCGIAAIALAGNSGR